MTAGSIVPAGQTCRQIDLVNSRGFEGMSGVDCDGDDVVCGSGMGEGRRLRRASVRCRVGPSVTIVTILTLLIRTTYDRHHMDCDRCVWVRGS
jgi:hypothetical protein